MTQKKLQMRQTFVSDTSAGIAGHLLLSDDLNVLGLCPRGLPGLRVVVIALPVIGLRLHPNVGAFVGRHVWLNRESIDLMDSN